MEIIELELDRQRELDSIKRMLRNETQKKLEGIQFHLAYHHQIQVVITSKEDLFSFINSDRATEEIIWDILDLLEQSYSRGYPNYIYEFQLQPDVTETYFVQTLSASIPEGHPMQPARQENTIITRIGDINHIHRNTIKFKVEYERRKQNSRREILQGPVELKTSFDIVFDFTCFLCYIQCGDRKLLSAVEDILKNNIVGVFSKFCSYDLKHKQLTTEFQGEYSLDKQTVIILDYVEDEINKDDFEIADYNGVSFSNSKSDKVKSVRLKGKNLLESYEVSDRIRSGDQIKSIRFQLRKRLLNGNYLIPTINLDFNGALKITLNNEENTNYNTDFIRHLVAALNRCLSKVYREQETKEKLNDIIQRARVRESMFIQSILAEMIHKLEEANVNPQDKEKFILLIDSYRVV